MDLFCHHKLTNLKSIVGAWQCAITTQTDVGLQWKKSCHATRESWKGSQELKITLRYLKGTYQSWVAAAETRQLIWASQSLLKNIVMQPGPQTLDDWRSTSGHCIYFGAILVSRCSKKQTLVANLITEAENKISVNTAAEILCLQSLFAELHISIHIPQTMCDNLSID